MNILIAIGILAATAIVGGLRHRYHITKNK